LAKGSELLFSHCTISEIDAQTPPVGADVDSPLLALIEGMFDSRAIIELQLNPTPTKPEVGGAFRSVLTFLAIIRSSMRYLIID
jgi:hypothetical protein